MIPRSTIVQLTRADLANALLPRVVGNAQGETVACHHSWMWREKHESLEHLAAPAAKTPGRPR